MSMIGCTTCDQQVAETAFDCPHCGAKLREPKRSFMGKLFKWSFILFNLLMLAWTIGGTQVVNEGMQAASGSAEQAGAAIGSALGMGIILTLWFIGDVILGLFVLFTRPSK